MAAGENKRGIGRFELAAQLEDIAQRLSDLRHMGGLWPSSFRCVESSLVVVGRLMVGELPAGAVARGDGVAPAPGPVARGMEVKRE